jgi:hypothetical protein
MESIYTVIVEKQTASTAIRKILEQKYELHGNIIDASLSAIDGFFNHLISPLHIVVEYPYVDKVYRNSYYHYYSSKLDKYSRDCIKLSFFKEPVTEKDFRDSEKKLYLQEMFGGFAVFRPTFPKVIGRSVIAPSVSVNSKALICNTEVNITVNGVKLKAWGFPHASQDGEMLTCAETTIWSLMEYFGNRYAEYSPVLPDKITKVLNSISFERLLPSKGLTLVQTSYAIKEFGFGVKNYTRQQYPADFERILKTYVESGIPVVALVSNASVGHALNIIGRENYTEGDIENLQVSQTLSNGIEIMEFTDLPMQYVMSDDNHPPYQLAYINEPVSYYTNPRWAGCTIIGCIVPLYPKIYLEANEARVKALLWLQQMKLKTTTPVVIKCFLSSSRTFKESIALNDSLDDNAKELLISLAMPKFIWVVELTNKELLRQNFCNGLIVLDATEPKKTGLIASVIENMFISYDNTSFTQTALSLQPFRQFNQNLKNF